MAEIADARPQADVGEVGRLGLHADEVLECRRRGHGAAVKEELAREQRAVQRAAIEDRGPFRHPVIL